MQRRFGKLCSRMLEGGKRFGEGMSWPDIELPGRGAASAGVAATAFEPVALMRAMFDAAVAAAQPELCLPSHLPAPPKGRLIVLGAGKASAAMARAVEGNWDGPLDGLVVTRYGYAVPCDRIRIVQAAHPVPDAAGEAAARDMLKLVEALTEDDLVLCLISGGCSSLLPLALPGISLADKQRVNQALLASGASIREMNCVRRHLSAIKGGRLRKRAIRRGSSTSCSPTFRATIR